MVEKHSGKLAVYTLMACMLSVCLASCAGRTDKFDPNGQTVDVSVCERESIQEIQAVEMPDGSEFEAPGRSDNPNQVALPKKR